MDGPTLTFHGSRESPPAGGKLVHVLQVASSNDHGCSIEHGTVSVDLFGQSAQGIVVALYLVADELAIDNRDIGPALPVLQAQFIDYKRVGSRMVSAQLFAVETRAYLGIVNGTAPDRLWAM